MTDEFSRLHPTVNFVWFAAVLIFAMFFMSPAYLAVSLICSSSYAIYLGGRSRLRFMLKILLPMMIIAAVINPLFNHRGGTILGYFPSGNPLTLESVLYGAAASVMLAATILWFSCFSSVMTTDKLICLFGRLLPSVSLLLSMSLRFAARFAEQMKKLRAAQSGIGCDAEDGGVIRKVKHGVKILSMMVTWSLENSIDTADSMRSRGFGAARRTSFSIYKFTRRDAAALIFTLAASAYIIIGAAHGAAAGEYFPVFKTAEFTLCKASVVAAYFALCVMPLGLDAAEEIRWKRIQSEI